MGTITINKAFDTVGLKNAKLYIYILNKDSINLLNSYFSNINAIPSLQGPISKGVPQGSVLGLPFSSSMQTSWGGGSSCDNCVV